MARLAGKTAIVTGGGSGFGEGIARAFAREGAMMSVADVNAEAAMRVAEEIGGVPLVADVSDAASVQAMAEGFTYDGGAPDILVNNAGVTHLPAPWLR